MSLTSRSIGKRSVDRNIYYEDDRFTQSISSPRENRLFPSQVSNKHSQPSVITATRNFQSPAKEFQVREQRQIQELFANKHDLVSKLHFICREIDSIADDISNKDEIIFNSLNQDKSKWVDLYDKKEQELQSLFIKSVEDEKAFQSQRNHLIKQIEILAQENQKLQTNVERLATDNKNILEKKDNLERERIARENQLLSEIQHLENEHRKKTEDYKLEYERQMFNLIQQYNQSGEAVRNLSILRDQLLVENKSLADEDKKNKNIIANLKLENEQKSNEINEKDNSIKHLTNANIELDKRGEQFKRNLIQIENENADIINRLSNSQRMNQEFELEIQTWVKKFGHLEQGHQQHLNELKRQIDIEKKNLLENEVQRQTQKIKLELSQYENRLRVESQKVEDIEKLYSQLIVEKENLQSQNLEMEQIIYEMKQDLTHFSELELDNRKMLAHIQYIEKKADQSFTENQRIKLAIDESKSRFSNREKQQQDHINRLESERDQLEKILQEHITEIERLRNVVQQQENLIEKSKDKDNELNQLKFTNEELSTRIKVMLEDIKNLQQFRAKYHELGNEYDKLKKSSQITQIDRVEVIQSRGLEDSGKRQRQSLLRY